MDTITRNVRDIPSVERSALEHVLGRPLLENQRLIIQVVDFQAATDAPAVNTQLPDWCDVYQGLSESEIDDLDRSIVRTHSTREFE